MIRGIQVLNDTNWKEIAEIVKMVNHGKMERGDMKFGSLDVTIYNIPGQGTLRVDFKRGE